MLIGIRKNSSLAYMPALDGTRAIAIIWVMLFHFTATFALELRQLNDFWNLFSRFACLGWVGVDIFFVISGFLIARILAANPILSAEHYRHFLARRVKRLLPAYACCITVVTLLALLFAPDSKVLQNSYLLWTMAANIASSFGDRAALMDAHFSLAHFWSLAVEWHFYLLYPLLLAAFRSQRKTALILIALALFCRSLFFMLGLSDNALYSFTACRIDSLAIGTLLATTIDRLPRQARKQLATLGFGLFSVSMFAVAIHDGNFKTLPWLQTFGYSAIFLFIAMMLPLVISDSAHSRPLRILSSSALTTVGRASYSLYLWHLVFLPTIFQWAITHFSTIVERYIAVLLIATAVSAAAGTLSYLLVEAKFLRRSAVTVPNPV